MGSCQSKSTVQPSTRKEQPVDVEQNGRFKYQTGTCALEYWEPIKELEEGSISSIHLVRRRPQRVEIPYREKADIMSHAIASPQSSNEEVFALKSIIKAYVKNTKFLEEMRNEIYTMSNLDHPNVAKVYEAYERHRHIYLIMEYCSGNNLCDRDFTETQAAAVVGEVLSAVAYMHAHKVVHRDIKLENIMFDKPGPDAQVKIIDFGLATRYLSDDHKRMTDRVGTLYSMAPQVLQGVYDAKCDLWSIGVVAYILLSGKQPFWGPPREMPWEERRKIMVDRIMRCDYMRMTAGRWTNISKDAKDFVASLLQMDPKKRLSAKKALEHPWIKRHAAQEQEKPAVNLATQAPQYQELRELKKSVRRVMLEKLSDGDLGKLREKLEALDAAKDGQVSVTNFLAALSEIGCPFTGNSAELSSTHIEYTELIADVWKSRCRSRSERCAELVEEASQAGMASREKLMKGLEGTVPASVLESASKNVSIDPDGMVSVKDFLSALEHDNAALVEKALGLPIDHGSSNTQVLATPQNTVIPGGRKDPSERSNFVFDEKTGSVLKSSHED
jgi:calcium-dependent protein kinase